MCRDGEGWAGPYGDWGCAPPLLLLELAVQELKIIDPNPEFIINGGDTFP